MNATHLIVVLAIVGCIAVIEVGIVAGQHAVAALIAFGTTALLFSIVAHFEVWSGLMNNHSHTDRDDDGELVERRAPQPLISPKLVTILIGAFCTPIVAGILWLSSWSSAISSDVIAIKRSADQLRLDGYTRAEAALTIQRLDQVDTTFERRLQDMMMRIEQIAIQQHRIETPIVEKFPNGEKFPRSR